GLESAPAIETAPDFRFVIASEQRIAAADRIGREILFKESAPLRGGAGLAPIRHGPGIARASQGRAIGLVQQGGATAPEGGKRRHVICVLPLRPLGETDRD